MNKLQEILEEFKKLEVMQCYCGNYSETPCFCERNFQEAIDFLSWNIPKYAESVVPEPKDVIYPLERRADGSYIITQELKNKNDLAYQYNHCRAQTLRRIDQDSQSLNN